MTSTGILEAPTATATKRVQRVTPTMLILCEELIIDAEEMKIPADQQTTKQRELTALHDQLMRRWPEARIISVRGPEGVLTRYTNVCSYASLAIETLRGRIVVVAHVGCKHYARHCGTRRQPASEAIMTRKRPGHLNHGMRSLYGRLRECQADDAQSIVLEAALASPQVGSDYTLTRLDVRLPSRTQSREGRRWQGPTR